MAAKALVWYRNDQKLIYFKYPEFQDKEPDMKAIVVDQWKDHKELQVTDFPEPKTDPGTIKIKIYAAALNFADLLMVQGKYQIQPEQPFVLGFEMAGVVVEIPPEEQQFNVGDRVLASNVCGAFAETTVISTEKIKKIPQQMSFEDAAVISITYPTSYAALVHSAKIAPGETLLVHGASGGVGLAAVQIAKALGCRVFATASTAEKLQVVKNFGAEVLINYNEEDLKETIYKVTDGIGVNTVFDPVGGKAFYQSLDCLAINGKILVIGFASGIIPRINVNRLLLRNLSVTGFFAMNYAENNPKMNSETYQGVFDLYERGLIKPLISNRCTLEEIPETLEKIKTRQLIGKAVCIINEE